MNTEKIVKEAKVIVITCSIVGFLLIGLSIILSLMDINFITNKKALVGLSFIPLSVALIYYYKIYMIKRSPNKVKDIIISENDERIFALKNEAAAKSFMVVQGAVFFSYMGYTLLVPEDIFESVGWWILLVLLIITFVSHGIISAENNEKHRFKR